MGLEYSYLRLLSHSEVAATICPAASLPWRVGCSNLSNNDHFPYSSENYYIDFTKI